MRTLTIATEEGDIEIREDELSTITDEDLRDVLDGISREDLSPVLKGTRRGAESRRKEIGGTTATHC